MSAQSLTFALTANTALTVLTGKLFIRRVQVQSVDPSITSFYDSVGNATTWARPSYSHRTIADGQTISPSEVDCVTGQTNTINVNGYTDTSGTVGGATVARDVITSIQDGPLSAAGSFPVTNGLTAVCTTNATLIVDFEENLL